MPVAIILLSLLGVAFFGIRAVANPAGWPADALGIAVCFIVGVHYAKVIRSNRRIASMTTIREVSDPEKHMALIPIGPRHPLFGVMLKVERAREHLDTLDREVGEFLERELYAVAPSLNAEADRQILTLKPKLAPPAHLGVVVGDVVHNLRSALDHLACALALLDDSGDPCDKWPKPQFPLTSTQQAWLVVCI